MIYLDTSALAKLVLPEPESSALHRWLGQHAQEPHASSEIIRVELPRAVMRVYPMGVLHAARVVAHTEKVGLTRHVLEIAASLPPVTLRSLDAIHLASALALRGEVTAFVAYDKRLIEVAEAANLPVASPA